jgi:hypothetical protein
MQNSVTKTKHFHLHSVTKEDQPIIESERKHFSTCKIMSQKKKALPSALCHKTSTKKNRGSGEHIFDMQNCHKNKTLFHLHSVTKDEQKNRGSEEKHFSTCEILSQKQNTFPPAFCHKR